MVTLKYVAATKLALLISQQTLVYITALAYNFTEICIHP